MEKINIREIHLEDYEAVMNIRNPETIYDGFDYLPDYYPVLMRMPGYKAFGAFIDNKLIAVILACLVDDGKVLITRAGRISKEYENLGIMGKIRKFGETFYGSVMDSHSFAFSDFVVKLNQLTEADKRSKILFRKALYIYRERQNYIMAHIDNTATQVKVKYYSHRDLEELMKSPAVCRQIFPDNRIFVDHVSYRLLKSIIPYILSHRCLMLGTNMDDSQNIEPSQRLLTIGNYIICPAGILYNIDVYGGNLEQLHNHIFVYLSQLKGMTNMDIQIELACSEGTNEQLCNETMLRFGLKRIKFFRAFINCAETFYNSNESNISLSNKAKL